MVDLFRFEIVLTQSRPTVIDYSPTKAKIAVLLLGWTGEELIFSS